LEGKEKTDFGIGGGKIKSKSERRLAQKEKEIKMDIGEKRVFHERLHSVCMDDPAHNS
jgi:hypothetical protein